MRVRVGCAECRVIKTRRRFPLFQDADGLIKVGCAQVELMRSSRMGFRRRDLKQPHSTRAVKEGHCDHAAIMF